MKYSIYHLRLGLILVTRDRILAEAFPAIAPGCVILTETEEALHAYVVEIPPGEHYDYDGIVVAEIKIGSLR